MLTTSTTIANVDSRPFFEQALLFGIEHNIITEARLQSIISEGATGSVQIAHYFGTAHLRTDLENAKTRMVNLISLYLQDFTESDLQSAAISLRDKTLLAHSKGGSDMLRRLHGLPEDTLIGFADIPDSEKYFLNDKSLSSAMSLAEFRLELKSRNESKLKISYALWLAKHLGTTDQQSLAAEPAESIINSAMLVLLMPHKKAQLRSQLPSQTEVVKLVTADRKKPIKLDLTGFNALLASAPREFHKLGQLELLRFLADYPSKIRDFSRPIEQLMHDGFFYLAYSHDPDDQKEYEKLVAKEWYKLTKGEDDDSLFLTILLLVATGCAPKPSMLLKDAKAVISAYRTTGFNTPAALKFIDEHAPHTMCEDLKVLLKELESDCKVYLADDDKNMPDQYMARALKHIKSMCKVAWKGRRD